MSLETAKDALRVVSSINNAIADNNPPTPRKIELCEDYIYKLSVVGLFSSAAMVDESLNRWCELLLDA